MMLAQGVVEYALLSGLAVKIERTATMVEDWVRGIDPRVAVGLIVIAVLGMLLKRR
jgi:hypothetical protein